MYDGLIPESKDPIPHFKYCHLKYLFANKILCNVFMSP